MTDRPILFSAAMIRALLAGTKTQTRRVIKVRHSRTRPNLFDGTWSDSYVLDPGNQNWRDDAYPWRVGDRLWVRESGVQLGNAVDDGRERDGYEVCGFRYAADSATIYLPGMFEGHDYERRRNSIHMPRWASRLTLLVTDVRVERLQDISEEDAIAEGVLSLKEYLSQGPKEESGRPPLGSPPSHRYRLLWNRINGPGSWEANPWVVALTFTVHKQNIDSMKEAA